MRFETGDLIGSYEIQESLGAGGMGEVYRAVDSRLDREIALKILPPVLADDEEALQRFRREAKSLASLHHPNIVGIYSVEEIDDLQVSTGQRKRLALVVTMLENRPIFVFDEVAADQDPEFRRHFYEEILGDLKKSGKTIVAATHDDRYFHVADRVLKLDYGKLVEETRPSGGRQTT